MTLLTDLAAWFDDVKAEFILNFIDKNRWRMLLTGLGNTLLIALLACLIGIVLGVSLATVAGNIVGITARASLSAITISAGVSLAVGVLFGYLPANKAAKLNPIDALRYD